MENLFEGMKELTLTWALDREGRAVNVDQVENGVACGCVCPCCGEALMAKNGGAIRVHHFAHLSGNECAGAIESALHVLAKTVLEQEKRIMLPGFPGVTGPWLERFVDIEIERRQDRSDLQPDAVGVTAGGERILIEFRYTHAVDFRKRDKLGASDLRCVEVDIHDQPLDKARMVRFLTRCSEGRVWVCHPEFGKQQRELRNGLERRRGSGTVAPTLVTGPCTGCTDNSWLEEWFRFMDSFTRMPEWVAWLRDMGPFGVAACDLKMVARKFNVDPADRIANDFLAGLSDVTRKVVELASRLPCRRAGDCKRLCDNL